MTTTLAPRIPVRVALALALAALWLGLSGAPPLHAQVPGLLPAKAKDAKDAQSPAPEAETPAQGLARAKRQLQETRAAILRNEPAPPGASAAEAGELSEALSEIASTYEAQIRSYDVLAKASASRRAAEEAGAAATALPGPPPYSILLVDELRGRAAARRARVDTLRASEAQLAREADRYFAQSRRADEALRRARETADNATGEARAGAEWRRKIAEANVRLAASRTTLAQIAAKAIDEEVAARKAELAALEADIAKASGETRFTREDLDAALARLQDANAKHVAARNRFAALGVEFLKQRDAASRELDRLRADAAASPEALAAAEARLGLADVRVRSNEAELDGARGMARLNDAMTQAWNDRFTASDPANAAGRADAIERLRALATTFSSWSGYASNVIAEGRAQLQAIDARRLSAASVPAAASLLQETSDTARRGVAALESVKDELDRVIRLVDTWVGDLDRVKAERSPGERAVDGWNAFKSTIVRVWNFELFSVEDSVVVDGQHVSVARGVTIGKSVGALALFLGGLWIVGRLLGLLERRMVARGLNAPRVRTFKRWTMVAAALVLLLITLNAARIPLTVFAFLGGALAIGVGFGTQTIIRNFISGMIVLGEQRVRIGDTIEVDGITGTVSSVDFRSTTVKGFDGVETIVPNSVLLENKVTNWTFTDHKVRRAVRIGVAYGSNLREVAEMLEETVKRHGNVLDDPPPQVYLDDFGDNAIAFTIHFWVDLSKIASSMRVMSDLRFMIGRRLDEAGVVIAFPQRDVHLDTPRPLRVEIVRAGDHAPPASG